jgi:hypothetical protein
MTTSIEPVRNGDQRIRVNFKNEGDAPPVNASVTSGAGH